MTKHPETRRVFMAKTGAAALTLVAGRDATTAERSGLDLNAMIRPIPKRAKFIDDVQLKLRRPA